MELQLSATRSKEIITVIIAEAAAIPKNVLFFFSVCKNYSCPAYFFN
jgi:hypothetical protein